MTLRRLSALFIVAAATLLTAVQDAAAQFGLPREVVTAQAIGPAQAQQIEQYTGEWLPRIASDDPLEIKRARDMLLTPLREQGVSVAFRQDYSKGLIAGLRNHAQDERELVIVNALRIAGELATQESAQLVEAKLRDSSAPVRLAAVSGVKSIFMAVRDASPAVGAAAVEQLVRRMGDQIKNDQEPEIVDASVRALAVAMDISRQNFERIRAVAFNQMTSSIGERTKRLEGGPEDMEMLVPLIRAGQIAVNALAAVNNPLGDENVNDAAELTGHLLAYVVRGLQGKKFPAEATDLRDVAAQLVSVAENGIVLAAARNRVPAAPMSLATDFAKGTQAGDRTFFQNAVSLLSVLTRAPFNFAPDHFQR